jgi:hypothetical protein
MSIAGSCREMGAGLHRPSGGFNFVRFSEPRRTEENRRHAAEFEYD